MEKTKIRRPNGLASISTKAKLAALVQAVATVAVVIIQGGVTDAALPTAVTTLITALIGLTVRDTVPPGTVVEYPEGVRAELE